MTRSGKSAWTAVWSIVVLLTAAAFPFGAQIPMENQLEVYEALTTLSCFVFGVMGAWMALVYPETLKIVIQPGVPGKSAALSTIRRLLTPMFISLIVIAASLITRLCYLVARFSFDLASHTEILRGLSFSISVLLSGLVLISLVYSIAPGLGIEDEFSSHAKRQREIDQVKAGGQRRSP